MASITPELVQNCPRCSQPIVPGALTCERCHSLVHSVRLEQLSAQARMLESKGQFLEAREAWLQGLPLLPPDSKQREWIQQKAKDLELKAHQAPPTENNWVKRLGPVGVAGALLFKAKSLIFAIFKLKFLFTFFAFFGVYWAAYGMRFGLGFATLILIHEMGHFIEIKRRGLSAELPVFIPFFGAYVAWQGMGVSLRTRALIALAGPTAGLLSAAACAAVWRSTNDPLWAALAHAGAWLNLLNLIPVWNFDGGHAALAMDRSDRVMLALAAGAMAYLLWQPLLGIVAAGAVIRTFFRDVPPAPDRGITGYFVALLGLLGWLLQLIPRTGPF